jgi:hypothetical protein
MTNQRFTTSMQLALAILIVVGAFAGGMAIAHAADRPALTMVRVADNTPPSDATDTAAPPASPTAGARISVSDTRSAASAEATTPRPVAALPIELVSVESTAAVDDHEADPCTWAPSAAELARNAEENADLAATLDRFEITYVSNTDEFGFVWLEWDWDHPIIDSVVSSFHEARYAKFSGSFDEVEECWLEEGGEEYTPTDEELAEQQEANDALISALAEGGFTYELVEDGPWAWVDFDWNDPEAVAATDAVYEELFGPFEDVADCEPIHDPEWEAMSAERTTRLSTLAAELEAAGVEFVFESDTEWAWLAFDIDDAAAVPVVAAALASVIA